MRKKVSSRHTEIPLNIFKYCALFLLDSQCWILIGHPMSGWKRAWIRKWKGLPSLSNSHWLIEEPIRIGGLTDAVVQWQLICSNYVTMNHKSESSLMSNLHFTVHDIFIPVTSHGLKSNLQKWHFQFDPLKVMRNSGVKKCQKEEAVSFRDRYTVSFEDEEVFCFRDR